MDSKGHVFRAYRTLKMVSISDSIKNHPLVEKRIKQIDRRSQTITIIYTPISLPLILPARSRRNNEGTVDDRWWVGFDPRIYRHPGKEQSETRKEEEEEQEEEEEEE